MASYHLSVKVGAKGKAAAHAEYIEREGEYKLKNKEKLEAVEHGNMPEWAQDNPNIFWQCADEYERKNGSTYREIEIALPRELTPQQRKELVQTFVEHELGEQHAYTWAIHTPKASIEGGEQPHAHIMYSERLQDGINRSPDQFFKRYNSKNPERGGCQKSNIAKTAEQRKTELVELRERFANLQNAYLEKYGHADRVDHRSLADQGIERSPEKHLGWKGSQNQQFKDLVLEYREANQTFQTHIDYLPKYLANLDQEQQRAKPKPLTDEQKREIVNQKIGEAKQTTSEYNAFLEKYRTQYIENTIKNELKKYQKQGAEIRTKIEELDKNKPMFFGKKAWTEKRENLVREYREIHHLHDHTKTEKKTQYLY
ncbi:MobA/MobL family protein, partial [Acinetobacter baumannii]